MSTSPLSGKLSWKLRKPPLILRMWTWMAADLALGVNRQDAKGAKRLQREGLT